ncbi:unnamed protein product, partial [Brachionus calyciflorus]
MVYTSIETLTLIILLIIGYGAYKLLIRGRHLTPESNKPKSNGWPSTRISVINSMQCDNKRFNETMCDEARMPFLNTNFLRPPEVYQLGMDGKSWLTVLESYLRDFEQSEWLRITIMYLDNKILKCLENLDELLSDPKNGFQRFKVQFLGLVTVNDKKPTKLETINWGNLNGYKQESETIREYGQNIINMV